SLRVPPEKLVLALEEFGNTSSASIPLAITHSLAARIRHEPMRLILAGFGVGYSWAAVALQTEGLIAPDLVVLDTQEQLAQPTDEQRSHLPDSLRRHLHARAHYPIPAPTPGLSRAAGPRPRAAPRLRAPLGLSGFARRPPPPQRFPGRRRRPR